jgi:hypothetical protein
MDMNDSTRSTLCITIAALSLAAGTGCSAGAPEEPVGEAEQAVSYTKAFDGVSGHLWDYWDPGSYAGFDALTMTNTLNQTWEAVGVVQWLDLSSVPPTQANKNACLQRGAQFYSSWYCGAWYTWVPEQQVSAQVALINGGLQMNCVAKAATSNIHFGCATEWATSMFANGDVFITTHALANFE